MWSEESQVLADTMLEDVISTYLRRHSWHGTPMGTFAELGDIAARKRAISEPIAAGSIQVGAAREDPSPAIMRLDAAPLCRQLEYVASSDGSHDPRGNGSRRRFGRP
jgi:hypothetical protein